MKLVLYFSFLLILGLSCQKDCDCKICEEPKPPACTPDLTKGLLAYYPFNGNFNDASGNGNNATSVNGAALTSDYVGRTNQAAGFDGVNDYLIVNDNGKLNSDSMSVSLQVMVNTVNRLHHLISRTHFDDATATVYGIAQSYSSPNVWNFAVTPNTEDCSKQHVGDTSMAIKAVEPTQAGRWYNIVVTFGQGVQKMYIDGNLVASKTRNFSTLKKCQASQLVIGSWWKNGNIPVDGKLDEVRIYNRVLSDCEIGKLAEPFQQTL